MKAVELSRARGGTLRRQENPLTFMRQKQLSHQSAAYDLQINCILPQLHCLPFGPKESRVQRSAWPGDHTRLILATNARWPQRPFAICESPVLTQNTRTDMLPARTSSEQCSTGLHVR